MIFFKKKTTILTTIINMSNFFFIIAYHMQDVQIINIINKGWSAKGFVLPKCILICVYRIVGSFWIFLCHKQFSFL
jgi:hypothetical protein